MVYNRVRAARVCVEQCKHQAVAATCKFFWKGACAVQTRMGLEAVRSKRAIHSVVISCDRLSDTTQCLLHADPLLARPLKQFRHAISPPMPPNTPCCCSPCCSALLAAGGAAAASACLIFTCISVHSHALQTNSAPCAMATPVVLCSCRRLRKATASSTAVHHHTSAAATSNATSHVKRRHARALQQPPRLAGQQVSASHVSARPTAAQMLADKQLHQVVSSCSGACTCCRGPTGRSCCWVHASIAAHACVTHRARSGPATGCR